MALRVNSVDQHITGPSCNHIQVNAQREAATGSFITTFAEVDALVNSFGSLAEADRALIMLWANYRRRFGRSIIGVDIA